MENAVKAILIASGVIVTLIVIALVVNLFTEGSLIIGTGTNNIELTTIAQHNSQFTTYEKNNLTYSNILSLIGVIVENNVRQENDELRVSVILEKYKHTGSGIYKPTGNEETFMPMNSNFINDTKYVYLNSDSVFRGKVFKVSLLYNDSGIIDRIQIKKIN